MASIIVFDLNETLLDMSSLDAYFETVFGDAAIRFDWFQTLEAIMLTSILLDENKKFVELSIAALQMTAETEEVRLYPENESNLSEAMSRLSPYAEVEEGLKMLCGGGFRVAALTNGAAATAREQLKFAVLTDYFEKILSAEDAGKLKPASAAYEYAADELDASVGDIRMVAAHAWDIAGANAAGCETAFIARPKKVLNPSGIKPEIYGENLIEVASRILEIDKPE